ncbi:MAG TPA: pyrroloquinoline quinone-dependent dehydrogenase, partial [Spongiibacteraceae bacterium]|nr:pyrroloquinoline quinone-dependent dehydrogenase [Spongiibacteraceae bacterium]
MRLLIGVLASLALVACRTPAPEVDYQGPVAEWPSYGGGPQSNRYSPLNQITVDNVDHLQVAWTHHSGDISDGSGEWSLSSFQATPIVVEDTLYYCSPFGKVFALDPISGTERWRFDPEVRNKKSGFYPAVCRGVAYWQAEKPQGKLCDSRILYGTRDAELIALDARTGALCPGFGNGGKVALREGVGEHQIREYYPTSPPAIIGDIAVIGAFVPDNERNDVPGGVVRAFDTVTGELRWAWDPVPEDYLERHASDASRYSRGSPNVWAPMSVDAARGLVFVPTGNPSPDIYAGDRDGLDYYGSSVVALDAATGKVNWHFQTVHHDVWDYDVASQPVLFEIPGVGGGRPGIIQPTKVGHVFLLDRETGEPLYPVEERPVPQGGVPGEKLSPTQPFPTHPAPLHTPAKLSADDMDGLVFFDRLACQREFAKYRNDGVFTPPSFEGSVLYPATTGGINWGSVSVDPEAGLMFVNQMHWASVVTLIPRAEFDSEPRPPGYPLEYFQMTGSPYGGMRTALVSPLGAPCVP